MRTLSTTIQWENHSNLQFSPSTFKQLKKNKGKKIENKTQMNKKKKEEEENKEVKKEN